MANRKISELGALTTPAADDLLAVVDVSEGTNSNKNKKITYSELFKSVIDGTETAPAFAFDTATTTGFYKSAANELSIATNGGRAIQVEANNKVTIYGDLVVTGGTTTVSSSTITVADKNIELATGNSSDAGATGGGLTIKGATDKTWNWIDSTDSWTSNQHIDVVSGMSYKIQAAQVLTATTLGAGVVNSSLTSVGTLGALTVTNAVTAGSLDISGGADIDGTLEADAYTVNGTALNEYIADTVGAMVSSNTETNITVTYEDSDNTLDFVIGTLNQDKNHRRCVIQRHCEYQPPWCQSDGQPEHYRQCGNINHSENDRWCFFRWKCKYQPARGQCGWQSEYFRNCCWVKRHAKHNGR